MSEIIPILPMLNFWFTHTYTYTYTHTHVQTNKRTDQVIKLLVAAKNKQCLMV